MIHTPNLDDLNPPQRQAVEALTGPVIVFAGAGSGKTRVITYRIAHMLQQGIRPWQILAVTFTNKAAKEMKERVQHLGGAQAKNVWIHTFHSLCARLLRTYTVEAGYKDNFTICDDDDQKALIKSILKELKIDEKRLPEVKNKIESFKNACLTPEEVYEEIQRESADLTQLQRRQKSHFGELFSLNDFAALYATYQKRLKASNAMDFNDLIMVMVRLLESHPEIVDTLQNRFQYFLVDEFQDTNPAQFRLIEMLSKKTNNIFVVGDDDQSIYSWRGAKPDFILKFTTLYPDAKEFKLEQNYRSTQSIVEMANRLISHNLVRAQKSLWSIVPGSPHGDVSFFDCQDSWDEARQIVSLIQDNLSHGGKLSDHALLYRTNFQSRSLEDELRRRMIPYVIYGGLRFYERAEIKDLFAYLRLLVNPDDNAAFQRAVNTPRRGVGDAVLSELKILAEAQSLSMGRTATRVAMGHLSLKATSRSLNALKSFASLFQKWDSELQMGTPPSDVLQHIIHDTRFEAYLEGTYSEDFEDRIENIYELKNALVEQEALPPPEDEVGLPPSGRDSGMKILARYLEQALLTVEAKPVNVKNGSLEAVTLMTIHSSKGLEFPIVFVSGLEEGTLPHANSLKDESNNSSAVEEERRLFYVAMTRARKQLKVFFVKIPRNPRGFSSAPSRFLAEVGWRRPGAALLSAQPHITPPTELRYEREDSDTPWRGNSQPPPTPQPTMRPQNPHLRAKLTTGDQLATAPTTWRLGQKVWHRAFGFGTLLKIEDSMMGPKLFVEFQGGEQQWLASSTVTAAPT